MNYVRIPKARVGVLIGPKGEYKKNLEKRTGCLIDVDSKNGMVEVSPKKGVDSLKALQVLSVVKAIGRGFPVEDAENLLDYEYYLEVLDIKSHSTKSKKRMEQIRARLIGRNGKTKHLIEEHSGVMLAIKGNTVSLIGYLEQVDVAKTAISMILNGAEHSSVYRYLEGHRRRRR